MTPEREIFQNARRNLNLLGASIFFALTLAFGSIYLRDSLKKNISTSEGLRGARKATLEAKRDDLASIRRHIAQFKELKQQGVIGTAEREAWVEQLVATRSRLGIGDSLNYVLKPPRSLAELADSAAGAGAPNPDPASVGEDVALFHDLEFEIRGLHEVELLALLREYRDDVKGRFRVQSCRLGGPTSNGLLAQCTLRFFSLADGMQKK